MSMEVADVDEVDAVHSRPNGIVINVMCHIGGTQSH